MLILKNVRFFVLFFIVLNSDLVQASFVEDPILGRSWKVGDTLFGPVVSTDGEEPQYAKFREANEFCEGLGGSLPSEQQVKNYVEDHQADKPIMDSYFLWSGVQRDTGREILVYKDSSHEMSPVSADLTHAFRCVMSRQKAKVPSRVGKLELIENFNDVSRMAETEASLRISMGLPPEKIETAETETNRNYTAAYCFTRKDMLSHNYPSFLLREGERMYEFFKRDAEFLITDAAVQGERKDIELLKRKLILLFFQAQMDHLMWDGIGFNDSKGRFQTWGANFILNRIVHRDFCTPQGAFDPIRAKHKKIKVSDFENGIKTYFDTLSKRSSFLRKVEEMKKKQNQSMTDLDTPSATMAYEYTLLSIHSDLKYELKNYMTNIIKSSALETMEKARAQLSLMTENSPWFSAVQSFSNLLAKDQSGLVIFPTSEAGRANRTLVLFKVRTYLRKNQTIWGYVLEFVPTDKLDTYIQKMKDHQWENKVEYYWKATSQVGGKFLVAFSPIPSQDLVFLMGSKDAMSGGYTCGSGDSQICGNGDLDQINRMRSNPSPDGSVFLDLRPYADQFFYQN